MSGYKNNNFNKKKSTSSKLNGPCANPVFEKWISEWKENAIARDLNSKHTYNKCLISLRKYPLPLNTGKECIILEGFGDKICKLIDEKLATFLNEGGVLHEDILIEDDEVDEVFEDNINKKSRSATNNKNTHSKKVTSAFNDQELNQDEDIADLDFISHSQNSSKPLLSINNKKKTTSSKVNAKNAKINDDDSDESHSVASQTNNKKNKTNSRKEYVPGFRSGPYALIVALHENQKENDEENFMLKAHLIQEAQKHCSTSFTSTDPNNHYTAWNSMSTLIKKNFVIKENRLPARYRLTESGKSLALRILYGQSENDKLNESSSDDSSIENEYLSKKSKENEPISKNEFIMPQKDVFKKAVSLSTDSDLIEIIDSDSDNDIVALEDNVQPKSKKIEVKAKFLENFNEEELPDINVNSQNDNYQYNDYAYESFNIINCDSSESDELIDISEKITQPKKIFKKSISYDHKQSSSSSSTTLTQKMSSITTESNFIAASVSSSVDSNNKSEKECILPATITSFKPGSFEIILFVDNCEQSHAKRQDLLIDELKKSGIKFESGKLNVGDFAWIARAKSGASFLATDIILNYIVERKRMDDLCASIIDGRYKEQKFRLKKSGISNAIYLIEEFGSIKHMSLPEKSLVQADVNTQLIENIIVHHTNDPKDSAHYLIEMTKYLKKTYENLTLNACLKENLDVYYDTLKTKKAICTYLMTFDEFNQFSNKNKPLTIKEMFAKCLLKIQGLSQEKCARIIEFCPTPSALFKEFSKYPDEAARTKLIANLKYGSQQRNIGPSIGKIVAQLFYTNGPLN